MAVNNTISVKEYALGTTASQFPITFEFITDDSGNAANIHCQRAEKNDDGQYINSEELSEGIAGDFQISGGNVLYLDDASQAGKYLVIYRSTPVSQLTDFIDNGNYSLEDIERALDKLTFILQERTGTPVGTYINVGVSLFFASILQLQNKKDFLEALFSSWSDIPAGDRPGVAAKIRAIIDAVSKTGDETVQGHKTFTYSPVLQNDPQTNDDATRKSYVDGKDASTLSSAKSYAKSYTDDHIIDKDHLKSTSGSEAVDTSVIRSNAVTLDKLRKSSETITIPLAQYEYDKDKYVQGSKTWNSRSKIPYAYDLSHAAATSMGRRGDTITFSYYADGTSMPTVTVKIYYVY